MRRLGAEDLARSVLLGMLRLRRLLVRLGILGKHALKPGVLAQMGNAALAHGKHKLAIEAYVAALAQSPENILLRLQLGVTAFLAGDYAESEKWFISCNHARHFDASRWGLTESPFRVLDQTWMLAIGHVAFLDTYLKAAKLGWLPEKQALLSYNPAKPPSGWPLFRYFADHMTIIPAIVSPEHAIDEIVHGPGYTKIDRGTRDNMRALLSQPFWYGPDAAGRTRWFAPYGAGVEAAWKAAGRGPLLAPNQADRTIFRRTMQEVYGLPADAWFVLLHVREPGYHAAWHKRHPGTRNADIRTYAKVIDFVLAQGGWVVRGGDPTMTRIRPRERVIDYATSPQRSSEIDILLCAECAYFVGTNSGFSVVPPVFGTRCALTNWSPIGIPNWYLDDIYIPKLVRHRRHGHLLTYPELFSTFAGWSQFQRDFRRTDLVIEDNSPEDLLATVQEIHAEIFGAPPVPSAADTARLQRFNEIAIAHGGYVGSRMSYRFLEKYQELLAGW
jgi:putative glycosyltransferase (TIGR04372 family)